MHLGALNSVLTAVEPDGERVDKSGVSPVMEALCAGLRSLRRPGEDPPQLVVLGDLFELALSSTDDAAHTFTQFVKGLRPGSPDAAVIPEIRFLAGNHDHHFWTRARAHHYVEYLADLPHDQPLGPDEHTSHLLPENDTVQFRDRMIELLAARAEPAAPVTVLHSYPNYGIVSASAERVVVLSHGHFVEPLYRLMSLLNVVFDREAPEAVIDSQLEAVNGAWIDFFWSSMGDSGDVGTTVRSIYESLQSEKDMDAEIKAIRRAIARGMKGHTTLRSRAAAFAVGKILESGVTAAIRRERHTPTLLSPNAKEGLTAFVNGPVAQQVHDEVGSPRRATFVFGHTHKPFVEPQSFDAFPMPVSVVNTGGWVVDTPQPEPVKGASVVLVDEDLNVAVLRCYVQGDDTAYRVNLASGNASETNPLLDELHAAIDPTKDPWAALGQATENTVAERGKQLTLRLAEDTKTLEASYAPTAGVH